ncbi:Ceg14 family Dot/Icm T4SS effector [Legionella cardiaca]|uniref:Transglutaminase-like domain-containing protein n=1 Tax=Legionella cardiaca TaxID=1071983 RepID=A0ABY8AUQ4_9GAMM|nr:Ceg14 family Dot/Icm T4SS effector [Legionella cardiaca]WED44318.1 hypothetical protein PXX05_05900 [Legionella cardiaca]
MPHPFPHLQAEIEKKLKTQQLDVSVSKLLDIANSVIAIINTELKVVSSNYPKMDGEEKKINEALVYYVQSKTDLILNDNNLSPLQRIFDCTKIVKRGEAGNCQHKAMLALCLILDLFIKEKIITECYLPSIELQYCDSKPGHFFLVLDNKVICDPWAQLSYPVGTIGFEHAGVFAHTPIRTFFKIDNNWSCYENFRGKCTTNCVPSYQSLCAYVPKTLYETHCNYWAYWTQQYYTNSTRTNLTFFKEETVGASSSSADLSVSKASNALDDFNY